MRLIIVLMLNLFLLTVPLAVISWRSGDLEVGMAAVLTVTCASGLLWHLTRKYRQKNHGIWTSIGLLLLSIFIPTEP